MDASLDTSFLASLMDFVPVTIKQSLGHSGPSLGDKVSGKHR